MKQRCGLLLQLRTYPLMCVSQQGLILLATCLTLQIIQRKRKVSELLGVLLFKNDF